MDDLILKFPQLMMPLIQSIAIEFTLQCDECKGTGTLNGIGQREMPCERCNGKGEIEVRNIAFDRVARM
jgi:DnaJ-class molecular chaperone